LQLEFVFIAETDINIVFHLAAHVIVQSFFVFVPLWHKISLNSSVRALLQLTQSLKSKNEYIFGFFENAFHVLPILKFLFFIFWSVEKSKLNI